MNLNVCRHKGNLRSLDVIHGTSYLCVALVLLISPVDNDNGNGDGDQIQRVHNLEKRKCMKSRTRICASCRFLLYT